MANALGILAGGGDLPPAIAQSALDAGREIFIMAIRGSAQAHEIERFPHDWASIGEAGKIIRTLKQHGCSDLLLAGRVERPRFNELKLDGKGLLVVAKVAAAALKGDDSLLRCLVDILEGEGFRAIGVAEAAPSLLAPQGTLGNIAPSTDDMADITLAVKTVRALGALDIGQAAAACDGVVLAVEAAEGTDAMIARLATLPENLRGRPGKRKGALVKATKPTQDGKTDLPVIGVQTVKNTAVAGLAGIAIEAGRALIINRAAVIAAADEAGMFLYGFAPGEFRD